MRIRQLAILGAALSAAAFAPHHRTSPERWALLVGISDYTNFGAEIGGDLPGAAPDAQRMRDVLVARWGFDDSHIKLLLNGEATRAQIEKGLTDWIPAVVKPNDLVVVFFAGHGSQEWDTNGDEADGLDETICPADVLKGDASRDVADDQIEQWLKGITAHRVVILDNCHSGTGTRAVTPFARPRSLARNARTDLAKPATASAAAGVDRGASVAAGAWTEIAAAQAEEVAVDAEWPGRNGAPSTYGGAFTTYLVRNLWRVPRRTSYEEIFRLTAEDMKRERFAQRPLFTAGASEGAAFASVEGEAADADAITIPVIAAAGTLQLAGGTGAGITVGSVYRAGDALLRVTTVQPNRAVVSVASGRAPKAGTPATLVAYHYPPAELRVSVADLDAARQQSLAKALAGISGLTLTTRPREFAHLIIRPAEYGYVIIGLDGARRREINARGDAAEKDIRKALESELSAQQLAMLENPAQTQTLEFGFTDGKTEFALGDEIAFMARVPRAGYLTIVDLGTNGEVNVIYPIDRSQAVPLKAGQDVRLPPGSEDMFQADPPAGRGMVRAFLTDRPLGLVFSKENPATAAQVAAALRKAAGNPLVAGSTALPLQSWLTTSIVYTISPK